MTLKDIIDFQNSFLESLTDTLDPIQKTFITKAQYMPCWRYAVYQRYMGQYRPEGIIGQWENFTKKHKPAHYPAVVDCSPLDPNLTQSTLRLTTPQGEKLLVITMYYTTCSILIQGRACKKWVDEEFKHLRAAVHKLASSTDTDSLKLTDRGPSFTAIEVPTRASSTTTDDMSLLSAHKHRPQRLSTSVPRSVEALIIDSIGQCAPPVQEGLKPELLITSPLGTEISTPVNTSGGEPSVPPIRDASYEPTTLLKGVAPQLEPSTPPRHSFSLLSDLPSENFCSPILLPPSPLQETGTSKSTESSMQTDFAQCDCHNNCVSRSEFDRITACLRDEIAGLRSALMRHDRVSRWRWTSSTRFVSTKLYLSKTPPPLKLTRTNRKKDQKPSKLAPPLSPIPQPPPSRKQLPAVVLNTR